MFVVIIYLGLANLINIYSVENSSLLLFELWSSPSLSVDNAL